MKFTFDDSNYQSFVRNDKYLVIDEQFLIDNILQQAEKIFIKNIKDINISLVINKVDLKQIKVDINGCSFKGFFIQDSTVSELTILGLEISEFKESKFKQFKTIIDTSTIQRLWINDSKFYNGFLIRRNCTIVDLSIWDSILEYSFTFLNSKSSKITIESSSADDISIDRNDYPVKGEKTEVETINIFRTTITKNMKIWEVDFKNIHFHKIKLNKSESLTDHNNQIFITTPDREGEHVVEEIKISESEIFSKVIISVDKINKTTSLKTTFNDFRINFWGIESFVSYDCKYTGSVYWGFPNHLKTINKFLMNSCIFENEFTLSDTWFKEECYFKSCVFQKYPSFFTHNTILENCKTDFKFSNLQNFVFQEIRFTHFVFENLDITNSQFKDCIWEEKKEKFIRRNIVADETKCQDKADSLIKLKDIYSKLKVNCQKNSDFINYGKFYISEQETKRKIHKNAKSWVEYSLLSFYKFISSYGENFKKPLAIMLFVLILFSFIYLFTGFFSGDRNINYELCLDLSNTEQTLRDWTSSLVFSLKNIVPFPMSQNFFLHSDKTTSSTQVLELFHKISNLVFATSFTAALIRYLRK